MNIVALTYPTTTIISLQEAKDHLRVTSEDEDAVINDCIKSATNFVEQYTAQYLLPRTFVAYFDESEIVTYKTINIWRYPITAITSVKYIDTNGTEQTLATSYYTSDITDSPARVIFTNVPTVKSEIFNAYRIYFSAGFTSRDSIDPELVGWVKILTAFFYETRQPQYVGYNTSAIEMNYSQSLDKYRKDIIV